MAPASYDQGAGSLRFNVSYRGKVHELQVSESKTLGEVAVSLEDLTGAALDTIKLILPKNKQAGRAAPTAVQPSSPEWQKVSLHEAGIAEGMSLLMSGASAAEVDAVSKPSVSGIADFDYEERRARILSKRKKTQLPLPSGRYVFAEFRAWQLPSISLQPPETKALKLMHRLASDPGVVAVMNKHKWRVGIMTELPPEGYVGVSPVCLLGFNRNRGMEISLRLRTDDLAGFRKYDSIRKTLLHELTHMVHDEHDEHFKALNSQLNREAEELDWTRKRAHTLGKKASAENSSEEDWESSEEESGKILGGHVPVLDPREAARSAALRRDAEMQRREAEGRPTADVADDVIMDGADMEGTGMNEESLKPKLGDEMQESISRDEEVSGVNGVETGSKDSEAGRAAVEGEREADGSSLPGSLEQDSRMEDQEQSGPLDREPDPDDSLRKGGVLQSGSAGQVETEGQSAGEEMSIDEHLNRGLEDIEPGLDDRLLQGEGIENGSARQDKPERKEMNADEHINGRAESPSRRPVSSPEEDAPSVDEEWQRAQAAAAEASGRVQKAVAQLKQEAGPDRSALTLKTLATILRNVMEHPSEPKYRRVRKTNATFFERVGRFQAALEVLHAAGFREESGSDAMVLQRDDPGLLWLTCSLVEASLA